MDLSRVESYARDSAQMWADHATNISQRIIDQVNEMDLPSLDAELDPREKPGAQTDFLPLPDNDRDQIIYQFNELGGPNFKNGPGDRDPDGISVAIADMCGNSPATCLTAMFNGRAPGPGDYYRETTWNELTSNGFVITPNGGQQIPGTSGVYPIPHASVTFPAQTYRVNGTPQWPRSVKRLFNGSFGLGVPLLPN